MKKYLISVALLALILVVGATLATVRAAQDEVHTLNGWAWSSNIGWISFNSADAGAGGGPYAVQADNAGNFSGYAWSPNIGWISFNPSHLAGCTGASAASSNFNTGAVTGWVRAYAGIGRTDGWDGCIELAGTNHLSGPSYNGSRGVTYHAPQAVGDSKGYFKGYAWGGPVVGWLQFSPNISTSATECDDCGGTGKVFVTGTCTLDDSSIVLEDDENSVTITPNVSNLGGTGTTGPYGFTPASFTLGVGTHDLNIVAHDASNPQNSSEIFCGTVGVTSDQAEADMKLMIARSTTALDAVVPGAHYYDYFGAGYDQLTLKKADRFILAFALNDADYPARTYKIVASNPGPNGTGWTNIPMTSTFASLESAGMDPGTYTFTLRYSDDGGVNFTTGSTATLKITNSGLEEI